MQRPQQRGPDGETALTLNGSLSFQNSLEVLIYGFFDANKLHAGDYPAMEVLQHDDHKKIKRWAGWTLGELFHDAGGHFWSPILILSRLIGFRRVISAQLQSYRYENVQNIRLNPCLTKIGKKEIKSPKIRSAEAESPVVNCVRRCIHPRMLIKNAT